MQEMAGTGTENSGPRCRHHEAQGGELQDELKLRHLLRLPPANSEERLLGAVGETANKASYLSRLEPRKG